jgi:hypothetical protein
MMATPILAEIKLYPLVGLKSFRIPEASGAWRLFVIAKNMAGVSDHVKRNDLRNAVKELGVNDAQFKRWLNTGRNLDLFVDVQRMSGEWMLILPSNKRAAELLGCNKLGKAVQLPSELLFKKGYRAFIFASWQAAHTGNGDRLVSQRKQAEITGINPQTQRQFNQTAGVESQKNFAISNIHANGYAGVLEFGNRACLFEYWDKAKHQKYLGWRIPDSRVFPLYGTGLSNSTPRKMSLFNRTPEQHAATMKTIRRIGKDDKEVKTKEIYTLDGKSSKGNNLWIHSPIY